MISGNVDGGRRSWSKNEYPPCNFWIRDAKSRLLWMHLRTAAVSHPNSQNSPRWAWILASGFIILYLNKKLRNPAKVQDSKDEENKAYLFILDYLGLHLYVSKTNQGHFHFPFQLAKRGKHGWHRWTGFRLIGGLRLLWDEPRFSRKFQAMRVKLDRVNDDISYRIMSIEGRIYAVSSNYEVALQTEPLQSKKIPSNYRIEWS